MIVEEGGVINDMHGSLTPHGLVQHELFLSWSPIDLSTSSKARFRRRSTHVPNLIELGSTLERHWRDN